jgi:CRP-like cAMP-binding protein/Fe-S-cluster-containing hydrogenase component 2
MSRPAARAPPEFPEMSKPIAEIRLEQGEPITPEELAAIEPFGPGAARIIQRFPGSIVLRRFRKGEVVCREGEFGSTAYFILEGSAAVSIRSPMAHVKTGAALAGFSGKLKSALVSDRDDPRADTGGRPIPVDAPVSLTTEQPVATLAEGSLFGEMTCLSFYPRSATVVAASDCVMLEMLRNVLHVLKKEPAFRERLENDYRTRAMAGHLRSVPLLAGLSDSFLERLRSRVSLVSYEPGEVICREGEAADAFYLVRVGFVRVSRNFPGGEMVSAYLSPGQAFGEMGLLGEGVRQATCTALDNVELVRFGADDFRAMTSEFPEVRARAEEIAASRREANAGQARSASEDRLDEYLEQGLMQAQSLLVIDLHRCTRCDVCVRACADTHDGVTRLVRDGLRFENYLVATSCRQCRDPRCMVGCPVGAIRRKESLEIVIEDWCIGCGLCASQCPYGNINMHPFRIDALPGATREKAEPTTRKKAIACDLCADLPEPACVAACPDEAAFRVEPRAFFAARIGERS